MRLSVRAVVVVAGTICAVAVLIGCSPAPSGDTTGAPAATGASSPILSTLSRWGDAAAEDPGNPAVAGRFYGVAFSDGSSVVRVLVNPAEGPVCRP